MASDNTVTIIGNLTEDPELRYTSSGIAVTSCRVAVNRRKFNRQTNEWDDQLDGFFTVNAWRDLAENVAESLHKGDRVMVQGYIRSRSYEDRDGNTRWVTEIEADEICPSLRWATASLSKVGRRSGGGGGGGTGGGGGGGGYEAPPPPSSDDVPF